MKNLIAAMLCLALAACAPSPAQTSPVLHFTWSNPTTYVDGTALPANLIDHTLISWGTTKGGPYPNQASSTSGSATSLDMPYPATVGSYYAVAVTVLTTGAQSGPSVEVVKTIVETVPKAPILNPPT